MLQATYQQQLDVRSQKPGKHSTADALRTGCELNVGRRRDFGQD